MFVEDDKLLEIVVYYKKTGRHYEAYSSNVFEEVGLLEDDQEENRAEFKKLVIKARQLTWGLYNDLQEAAMVKDNLGNRNWNYKVYKENKLRSIIAKWDAQMENDEGKMVKVPVTPMMIAKMSPDIAEVILNSYDQLTLIDEDAEKKS